MEGDSPPSKIKQSDIVKYKPPATLAPNWPSTGSQPRIPFASHIPRKNRRAVLNKGESINAAFFTPKNTGKQISFHELNQRKQRAAVKDVE